MWEQQGQELFRRCGQKTSFTAPGVDKFVSSDAQSEKVPKFRESHKLIKS